MGSDWIMDPMLHLVDRSSGIIDPTLGSTDMSAQDLKLGCQWLRPVTSNALFFIKALAQSGAKREGVASLSPPPLCREGWRNGECRRGLSRSCAENGLDAGDVRGGRMTGWRSVECGGARCRVQCSQRRDALGHVNPDGERGRAAPRRTVGPESLSPRYYPFLRSFLIEFPIP